MLQHDKELCKVNDSVLTFNCCVFTAAHLTELLVSRRSESVPRGKRNGGF